MTIRDSIDKRVSERLEDYYPNQGYVLGDISQVSTKPGSSVYRIRILDRALGHRDLYVKEFRECLSGNIREMIDLWGFHSLFLMPRILDYYEDENILISEGAPGDTLTRAILGSILSNKQHDLLNSSWKIGWAIGALQNLTPRGVKRVGDLDLCLIREIESEAYFNRILGKDLLKNIRAQAEEMKGLKTRVAQHHGDPSPHNILIKGGQVSLIDYSFQDNATFMDPSLYIVSLELARARYGLPVRNTISNMEKKFMEAYSQMTKETYDRPIWSTVKNLTYLHFLLMYAKRKKTIKNTLVASIDRLYLLKKVRDYGKSL